jgi:dihydroorotate dehydrogenase
VYSLARKILFRIDPEKAHELTLGALPILKDSGLLRLVAGKPVYDPVDCMGLRFPNRLGLAAGLDKNGEHIDAFGVMGFGFVEVGTVTPLPQPGNDKPRLFRIPSRKAIINRMGFNNHGIDALVTRAAKRKFEGVLGINIGKNKVTPNEEALSDYLIALEKAYPVADYIAVNISSPNTEGLRELQGKSYLLDLLTSLKERGRELERAQDRRVPIAVKIAPDLDDSELQDIVECLLESGIDGVIATNTTISREAVKGEDHAEEAGGLSGVPVCDPSTEIIAKLRKLLGPEMPIIGVGGIFSAADAQAKLDAGANLVQIYSGLIYQGPGLIREILSAD